MHLTEYLEFHHGLTPESKRLKELMIDGYVKSCTNSIVPLEINKICYAYYNEVLYFNIDIDTNNGDTTKTAKDEPDAKSEKFMDKDIVFQMSLYHKYPYFADNHASVLYANALLPSNIDKIGVYADILCPERDANWKHAITFVRSSWQNKFNDDIDPNQGTNPDPVWKKQNFVFADLISTGFVGAYLEILSIDYNDNTPNYNKQIFIKESVHFEWNMNKEKIQKFREFQTGQIDLSDTFDEVNNNWGFYIYPMGIYIGESMESRMTTLTLCLYHMPVEIKKLNVTLTVIDDHLNETKEREFVLYKDGGGPYCNLDVFPSEDLFDIKSLSLSFDLRINGVAWIENVADATKDMILQN